MTADESWDGRHFVGTGFPPEGGEALVSVTHARLRRAGRRRFFEASAAVVADLDRAVGGLGRVLRKTPLGGEVWTVSLWQNAAALDAFTFGAAHGAAMREASDAIEVFRSLRFHAGPEVLPVDWEAILARLEAVPLSPWPPRG